jgi:hypothetical protein
MIKSGRYSQDNYSFILPLCFHELLNVHFKLCVVGLPMSSLNLCKDELLALVANIIADKRLVYSEKISLTVDAS